MGVCAAAGCGHGVREHFGRPACRLCGCTRFVARRGRGKPAPTPAKAPAPELDFGFTLASRPDAPPQAAVPVRAVLPSVGSGAAITLLSPSLMPKVEPMTPAPAAKPASDRSLPEEVFEAIELPKREFVREALRVVASTPGVAVPEVARRIGVDVKHAGRLLRALHRKGLLEVGLAFKDGKEERLHHIAGNMAGMLRAKAARFLKAAEALEAK